MVEVRERLLESGGAHLRSGDRSVIVRLAWLAACVLACGPSRPPVVAPRSEPQAAPAPKIGRAGWGVIEYREVGITGATFTLESARACSEVPAPAAGRDVVLDSDAERMRCRLRPWHGRVSLAVRHTDGAWTELAPLQSDREGRLRIRFAELERELRDTSGRPLAQFVALRVGQGGWGGTYDLARLRELQADVHASWIGRGRGVPALFGVLHPTHSRAGSIAELAVEARLARQEQDFAAIERGELAPEAFLDRHVWSPLRVRVAAMLSRASVTPE